MFEDLISKDDLKQQTEFYDSEIVRLTEEIAQNQNIGAKHQQQIDGINAAIKRIRNVANCDTENTMLYAEIVDKIVVPKHRELNVYLNGIPFGFKVKYTVMTAPRKGIYDIVIDACEIIS